MNDALILSAILLAAAFAGCAQPAATAPVEQAAAPPVEERPDPTFGAVATGPAAGPDLDATTAAPPRLVAGEWWRIRFESSFFPETPEVVRVVAEVKRGADGTTDPSSAEAHEGGYVIGMPHEGWYKEAVAFHAPAFGDVGLDLSYATHNVRFEPVRFPLVQGATWTTYFGTTELVATVEQADAHTATVRFDAPPREPTPTDTLFAALDPVGDGGTMRLVYDARQHEVVRFESLIGTWEVVEHGYGYEGWITIPRGIHTALDHGQFLPATPGEPVLTRTRTIEGGFNRLTILQGVFALGPGAYRAKAVGPDGTEYVTEHVGGKGFTVGFHEAADPDGPWTLEDVVGGPGGTYTMGMAYHQYDVRLPDGARRGDHAHDVKR